MLSCWEPPAYSSWQLPNISQTLNLTHSKPLESVILFNILALYRTYIHVQYTASLYVIICLLHFQPLRQQPAMTLAFLWMGLDMGTVRSLVTAWRFSVIQATSCKARTPSHVYGWRTDSTGSLTLRRVSVGEHYTVGWIMWSDVKYSWPVCPCWRTRNNNCVSEHRTLITVRSESRLLRHLCKDANHSLTLNMDLSF